MGAMNGNGTRRVVRGTVLALGMLMLLGLLVPAAPALRADAPAPGSDAAAGESGAAAPDPAGNPADRNPALEAQYAAELRRKLERETERNEASLRALFWGVAVVMLAMLGMGGYCVYSTVRQQRMIDHLTRQLQSRSSDPTP